MAVFRVNEDKTVALIPEKSKTKPEEEPAVLTTTYRLDGSTVQMTNHSGGICGGLTTGMPVVFRAAFKPTPSIAHEQRSVSLPELADTTLTVTGRHDPCVVTRAAPAVEAAAALGIYDLLLCANL